MKPQNTTGAGTSAAHTPEPCQLFSFSELSEEAKKRVIARESERVCTDYEGEELVDSMKAIASACNLRVLDWSIGTHDQNWKFRVENYNFQDLSGRRALAWFLRILIKHGYTRPARFQEMTFPGVCGFTGVCHDDSLVESLWESMSRGETVKIAFDLMAYKVCRLWESADEYARSEECILDCLDQSAKIYTEDGEEF